MILLLAKQIDLGRYNEVLNLANRFQVRLEMIAHIDWATTDLSALKPSETLYISAHGSNSDVEGRAPDKLAEELVGKGLKDGVAFKKLKLMSCGSGITAGSNVPYCQRLAAALANKKGPKNAVVVGFDGATTVCDQGGKIYAKDTKVSAYPNWGDFQTKHGADYALWNQKAKSLPCGHQAEFLNNARLLLGTPEVKAAFEWLYKENAAYVKDRKAGKTYADQGKSWKK